MTFAKRTHRAFSSLFLADRIALTCQAFVVSNVLATSFDCVLTLRNRNSFTTMAEQRHNNGRTMFQRQTMLVKLE